MAWEKSAVFPIFVVLSTIWNKLAVTFKPLGEVSSLKECRIFYAFCCLRSYFGTHTVIFNNLKFHTFLFLTEGRHSKKNLYTLASFSLQFPFWAFHNQLCWDFQRLKNFLVKVFWLLNLKSKGKQRLFLKGKVLQIRLKA